MRLWLALCWLPVAWGQVQFATYLGGGGNELARSVATDAQGNVYVAGRTDSPDFPLRDPIQSTARSFSQIYLAKFAPDGTLLRSTYLGGTSNDEANAIAIDAAGNIYVAGDTHSTDFPTAKALQPANRGGVDAFVTKLDPSFQIIYSTYLGGNQNDLAYGIAAGADGSAYICGRTESGDFPTSERAFQRKAQQRIPHAFVTKLDPKGALVYSTFLAGSQSDIAWSIAVDASGQAHIAGETTSPDFPIANAFQSSPGRVSPFGQISADAFIAKLNADGTDLVYSTYLGGAGNDFANGIALNADGVAYITGQTNTGNFPALNGPVAYLSGGAYGISDDTGQTLTRIKGGLRASFISRIAFPCQSQIVLAATTDGIYRSEDGGQNWTETGLRFPTGQFAIDPANCLHVVAGTGVGGLGGTGLYGSYDGGANWFSMNEGAPGDPAGNIIDAIAIDPADGSVYADVSFGGLGFGFDQPLYRISYDGTTWTPLGHGLASSPRAVLVDPNTGALIVATATVPSRTLTVPGTIYRRVGDSWVSAGLQDDFYTLAASGSTLYAGGRALYRSSDGGVTWTPVPIPSQTSPIIAMQSAPDGLYLQTSASQLFRSTDDGQTWSQLPVSTRFSTFAVSPADRKLHFGLETRPDGFVAAFDPAGALVYSTFLGVPSLRAESIALDGAGRIFVAGFQADTSVASLSVVTDSVDTRVLGGSTAFTILGIPSCGVTVDAEGNWIAAFIATQAHLPVANAAQPDLNGSSDAYIIKGVF